MLEFDSNVTRILDTAYLGADITRRRRASFDALNPVPRDVILDVGCGNGLLTAELARAVGPEGRIIGVDQSRNMLELGAERCAEYQWVELLDGSADNLPVPDAIADKAVSVQVFEYIKDVIPAISEMLRCLKPGGRLVISDLHFGTLVWFSENTTRMANMLQAWEGHFASGNLPERLPGVIRSIGHPVEDVATITLTDHVLKPDGLAITMMHLMKQFAIANNLIAPEIVEAWFDEQHALANSGKFFFSITQFVIVAQKAPS